MSVTVESVLAYVGGNDTELAATSLQEATDLVYRFAGVTYVDEVLTSVVPVSILDRAILETSSELYHRRNAPGGIQQFAGVENPVRINKDPLTSSYSLLKQWVVGL